MKNPGKPIGRVELEVLRYVTEHQPVRVRDVAEHMADASGQARTTILTVLERLRAKGFLKRRKIQGVNHYASKVSKSKVVQDVVGDFVDGVLQGSVSPFVAYLSQSSQLTPEEIDELKKLVAKLDTEGKRKK